MKYTENFMELPIVVYTGKDADPNKFYYTTIKALPRDVVAWFTAKADDGGEMLVVKISSFGEVYVRMTEADFEKYLDEFVGEPVSDSEKQIALTSRVIEMLKNQPE